MAAHKGGARKPKAPPAAIRAKPAAKGPPPRARVVAWMDALKAAGADTDKARAVLNQVRDDARASRVDKEHFYRALAQQSLVWFLGAVEGRPLTAEEVRQLAQAQNAGNAPRT